MLSDFKKAFIEFCMAQQVLMWGDFTLKSGRKSPYFFNAGKITSGAALAKLGHFYAQYVQAHGLAFDCLVGPAYKGILLAASTATAMAHDGVDMPFVYNRKEVKDHGEGGLWVGEPKGNCCVVDDVITSGATVTEVVGMMKDMKDVRLKYWLIMMDRQENLGGVPASEWVKVQYGIETHALITLDDLIAYLADQPEHAVVCQRLREYR